MHCSCWRASSFPLHKRLSFPVFDLDWACSSMSLEHSIVWCALPIITQQIKQNRDDYKALTTSIILVLDVLHEEVKAQPDATRGSARFNASCAEFKRCVPCYPHDIYIILSSFPLYRYMDRLLIDIEEIGSLSRTKQYLRSSQIRTLLARYRREIDEFRSNLMVYL